MIEEIMHDFYRIEIPLPLLELQSVNCYAIKGPERHLIIDAGMDNNSCRQVMEASLKKLEIDLDRTDFFITHCHIDHFGLVTSLVRQGSIIYINRREADMVYRVGSGDIVSDWMTFIEASGFPEDKIENIFPSEGTRPYGPEHTFSFIYLEDGDTLSMGDYHFKCVETPGHTNGHMCLYEPQSKVFMAGDHLLNEITPGIHGFTHENPLKDYLSSLDKVAALDVRLVLPGHGSVFGNRKGRIEDLKTHHEERVREVISILEESPKDAYDVASQMTWDVHYDSWRVFPIQQRFFATGEAFAHLRFLEEKGVIVGQIKGKRIVYSSK